MPDTSKIILLAFVSLTSLTSCSSSSEDAEIPVEEFVENSMSCKNGLVLDGFRDLRKIDLKRAKIAYMAFLKEGNNPEKYCQKISYIDQRYCIVFLLKDGSPGGDITYCYSMENNSQVSRKFGYGDEVKNSNTDIIIENSSK